MRHEDEIAPGFVAIGRILTVWGLSGDLKVEALAPDAELVAGRTVAIRGEPHLIKGCRRRNRFLHVKLEGVDTPEEARTLRGAYIQVPETELAALEPDSYYRYQLMGLSVRTTTGRELGRITDILTTGGNDVYTVTGPLGEVLLPATDQVIRAVDLQQGTMTIEAIPGLLPGESP